MTERPKIHPELSGIDIAGKADGWGGEARMRE
jgi:hypothetical protein